MGTGSLKEAEKSDSLKLKGREERGGREKSKEMIQLPTDVPPSLLAARNTDRPKVLKCLPTYLNVTGKTICYSPRASSKAPDWDYPTGPATSSDLEDDSDGHIHLAGMKRQELSGQLLLEAVCDLLAPVVLAERLSSLPWHSGLVPQKGSVSRARKWRL